ncbi:MAG TPA: RNA-guided endonuclease TnpB family protein [Candidatus Limnocylindrales bacterium]
MAATTIHDAFGQPRQRMHDAFRFELDLNDRQRTWCVRSAGVARYVWNWGLRDRIDRFEHNEGKAKFISAYSQQSEWVKVKPEWAYEVSCWASVSALGDLDAAFRNFWQSRKAGRRVGFPRFKAHGKSRDAFKLRQGVRVLDERHIRLPGIGSLKIKGSTRRMSAIGYDKIMCATVSRQAERWFVSFSIERQHEVSTPPVGEPVGIDVALRGFVLSTGEEVLSPRPLKNSLRKLRRAQQAVARSQRNSASRKRKLIRVARIHRRVANQRSDWLHKFSDRLTREHPVIGHETLNIAGLKRKGTRQGRSWADLGAAEFFRQLAYKGERRGVCIVAAPRFYPSSKTCSGCQAVKVDLPLSVKTYVCDACGLVLDRDFNAALNLRSVAVTPTETLNAGGGIVRLGLARAVPAKPEPSTVLLVAA